METIPEVTVNAVTGKAEPNTPWGLWTAAGREKKDLHITQGSMSATVDDSKRVRLDKQMKELGHSEFERKA